MARVQGRVAAVALSATVHVLFFAWLIAQRHAFPAVADAPAMLVSLVPSVPHRAPAPVTNTRQRSAPHPIAPATAQPVRPLLLPQAPPAPAAAARPDGVQQTLRGLIGCLPGLEPHMGREERERCREQFAAQAGRDRGSPPQRLDLDKGGEFAASQNAEPYLQRRPKNGCKTRAGGDTAPGPGGTPGKVGAAIGIGCALSF